MANPFENLRDAGVSTFGYGVTDAPDQRLREIAIKTQSGMALTPREVQRLAQRQGVELEASRLAGESVGVPRAGVPSTVFDYLAGTRLDPVVQQAASAEAALAANPLLAQARLQEAANRIDPVGAAARAQGLLPDGTYDPRAKLLFDAQITQRLAEERSISLDEAEALRRPSMTVAPSAPAAPSTPASAPAPAQESSLPASLETRIAQSIPKVTDFDSVVEQELRKQYGDQPFSALAKARTREKLLPKRTTRTVNDPLTKASYEVETDEDVYGNVYRVGAFTKKGEGAFDKLDTEFSKEATRWLSGASQQSRTNAEQLRQAVEVLKDPTTKLASGRITSLMPEWMRVRLASDKSASVRSVIEQVAQQSLRETLGAQFTQKEGEAFLSRVFDVRLPEEENARRAEVLLGTISRMAADKEAAANYFQAAGTLAGFKGNPNPSLADVEAAMGTRRESPSSSTGPANPARARAEAAAKRLAERKAKQAE